MEPRIQYAKIRAAGRQDLDHLVGLWCQLMQFHQELDSRFAVKKGSEETWRDHAKQHMTEEDRFVFLAEVSGEVVGYIIGSVESNPPVKESASHGLISAIHVRDEFRRKGIGTQLWRAAVGWFKAKEQTEVELMVATLNRPGQTFWRSQGFDDFLDRLHRHTQ